MPFSERCLKTTTCRFLDLESVVLTRLPFGDFHVSVWVWLWLYQKHLSQHYPLLSHILHQPVPHLFQITESLSTTPSASQSVSPSSRSSVIQPTTVIVPSSATTITTITTDETTEGIYSTHTNDTINIINTTTPYPCTSGDDDDWLSLEIIGIVIGLLLGVGMSMVGVYICIHSGCDHNFFQSSDDNPHPLQNMII